MARDNKMVSVIIPVFNLEDVIERCLNSIMNQSYSNLEILVLDDGSTDESYRICKELSSNDRRIRCFHHSNHGVSYTRNRGIRESIGDYLIFIDGDDETDQDMIEQYVSAFSPDIDMVIGGITVYEIDGTTFAKQPTCGIKSITELLSDICKDKSDIYGYAPNKMYRADLIKKNNITFREDMAAQEDFAFALTVFESAKTVRCIPYTGYHYYHQEMKREMPTMDLLGNQLKLCAIANEKGCESSGAIRCLQDQVYSAIFWAKTVGEIERMYSLRNLLQYIHSIKPVGFEKRLMLHLFESGKTDVLFRYFKFRNRIKYAIRKNI